MGYYKYYQSSYLRGPPLARFTVLMFPDYIYDNIYSMAIEKNRYYDLLRLVIRNRTK